MPASYLILALVAFANDGAVPAATQGVMSAAPEVDADVQAMQEVYADTEFWWKRQREVETPWAPLAWLVDVIGKFFQFVWDYILRPPLEAIYDAWSSIWNGLRSFLGFPLGGTGLFLGTIVLSLVLFTLLAFLVWKVHPFVWQWLKSGDGPARERKSHEVAQEELPETRLLLNQAAEAIEQGKYREAIRFAFLALLACLQNRGRLRYDRSRTNREYLSDLREFPHLAVIFREAARPYERAWFGQAPVTNAETEHVLGLCRQLVAEEEATR